MLVLFLLAAACTSGEPPAPPASVPFPVEWPDLSIPDKFELTGPLTVVQDQKVEIESDAANL